MKLLTSVFALLMCASVFAQEKVLLESKEVSVNGSEAILVRTNKTPKKVKVTFKVPMSESVCEQYDTRYVVRTSGSYCGYYTTYRIVHERVCVRRDRQNRCSSYQTRARRVAYTSPRSCPVPETYCSRYGTATHYGSDSVTIKFKGLPALADSEQDSFLVAARQKSYDATGVVYDVEAQETVIPYVVKDRGFLGFDKFVIKVK